MKKKKGLGKEKEVDTVKEKKAGQIYAGVKTIGKKGRKVKK